LFLQGFNQVVGKFGLAVRLARASLAEMFRAACRRFSLTICAAFLSLWAVQAGPPAVVLDLWPGIPPGESGVIGDEKDMTKPTDQLIAGRRVIRLGNVTRPTLSVYRPPADKDTGAAVLVCPGGGYQILALDLEGSEVCEWLNSIGVTGVLLKYRVPKRPGLDKDAVALPDAQRALGLMRQHAQEWGLDPQRLGVLGFSAGGHLSAALSTRYQTRAYAAADAADQRSCRPDFAVLIYPGYLTDKEQGDRVAADLPLSTNTPPMFLAMSWDDPVRVENALGFSAGLKQAKVPFELHIYPAGGHGYGLRRTENPVTSWPDRTADWMRANGWLRRR
jgi:acetyl esterase/lipase